MMLLREAGRRGFGAVPSRAKAIALAILVAMLPTMAAAGEADVHLDFAGSEIYLVLSGLFGVIAIIAAAMISKWVKAQSPGSENMREVGGAIREGALAYLVRQIKTMIFFVVAIGIGLFFLYHMNWWVPVAFIGGVAASYIAGYSGMKMAVEGNMRTANAALTSYKRTLEIAFRSGAVAGLVTVGMGLIGATIILWLGGGGAMTLLIGFGFGGSLAALFMRVGGGIFTKAADVGADLVGKVEAGIPEDDPRNPATIADNVGDNVGDCAGMAADIFESYEVTLVAAIVLGAAASSIFDTQTWMKLILFALMARGIGIIASIFGILSVRGSDNVELDPLKAIRKGFYSSAIIALALTAVLAWYMMGRPGSTIETTQLLSQAEFSQNQVDLVAKVQQRLAAEHNLGADESWKVSPKDYLTAPELQDVIKSNLALVGAGENPTEAQKIQAIGNVLRAQQQSQQLGAQAPLRLRDFTALELNSGNPALDYTILKIPKTQNEEADMRAKMSADPELYSVRDAIKAGDLDLVILKTETSFPSAPGAPPQPPQTSYLLTSKAYAKDFVAHPPQNRGAMKFVGDPIPATLFANKEGDVVVGADIPPDEIRNVQPMQFQNVFAASPAYIKDLIAKNKDQSKVGTLAVPLIKAVQVAATEHTAVPWWSFLAALGFGIFMAFAIEYLTDYYVSTHKSPTQEVAGVSTAGPAPMIIQGFAYALESSVFMVLAIVVALLVPLYLFNPVTYGSPILSFYGIALVGLGLLTTTGYVLAMDTFGPISDNAQGVYEMSGDGHSNEYGSKAVQRLDAAGNTTKALTKGFAIATAVVAAVALFHSYLEDAKLSHLGLRLDVPEIFLGLLIGGAAPYLFSAFSINAVGRASFQLINEVRRQFKADPGIMAGTSKPNYGSCVSIVTAAAQKELLGPGILAIFLPIAVAFGFSIGKEPTAIGGGYFNLSGAQALGGFLAGAILSGQLMAVLLANSGGMWDNAKKIIEDGLYGGKGTDAHKAGVVCDTVGDPFKDTAGPALNPLIKVMNLVALLLAPVIIQPFGNGVLITITALALLLLIISIYFSKRGSLSTEMAKATEMAHEQEEHPSGAAIQAAHSSPGAHGLTPPGGKRRITVEEDEPQPPTE